MRYEMLGPLQVVNEAGDCSAISAPKIETVFAVLLIRANQVVPIDQLMTEIWGDNLPRRATAGLHVYISQLRKFLCQAGRAESPVVTQSPGYVLHPGADVIDFHLFLQLMNQGRAHVGKRCDEAAAGCFEKALALWRGPVLGDLRNGPIVDGFATWLMELRLECLEMMTDAQLRLGRHRELVGWLYSLISEYPLRETLYRQLMLALYRSESQADALRVYQTARETLNNELGLEPGRALRNLHQAILTADDQLEARAASW